MDGPYGNTWFNIDDPDMKIMIFFSGGVGMTPNLSMAKKVLKHVKRGRKMVKIIFVYRAWNEDLLPFVNSLVTCVNQYKI